MNGSPCAEWSDLTAELDIWGAAGRSAGLWWRDDDATTATPQLAELLRLTAAAAVPLALAVIPAFARPELAEALVDRPQVAVLQHGWQHVNRAAARATKKSEYPPERPAAAVDAEIAAGRARLEVLFGPRALPVFVPPWNCFANKFLTMLPGRGIAGLSGMASPRSPPYPTLPRGLTVIDVHLDLVAWRGDRGFIGEAAALAALLSLLQAQRERSGADSGGWPIGILTHHLVIDRATAGFFERLLDLTLCHRAVRWAGIADLL